MLELGINTYCSLEDADSLVKELFPIGDNYAYWNALNEEQKEQLLINSASEIEKLPIAGVKLFWDQPLQFPRRSNFYRYNETPKEVIEAQVINAVEMMLTGIGIKEVDGRILTSALAEKKLRVWTSGGFKMEGYI